MRIEKNHLRIWTRKELALAEANGNNPKEEMKENFLADHPQLSEEDAERLAEEKYNRVKNR